MYEAQIITLICEKMQTNNQDGYMKKMKNVKINFCEKSSMHMLYT